MSSIAKKYQIRGWRNAKYRMTAKQIYERVLSDSKSNYNWIAPATELVRVCNERNFPEKYAIKIKCLILNCFANLELCKGEIPAGSLSTDDAAVYSCYDSLPNTDEEAVDAKENYLKAVIAAAVEYDGFEARIRWYSGPVYEKKVKDWKEAKFAEYASAKEIDFDQLRKDLSKDFDAMIKKAEDEGIFDEDIKRSRESMKKFIDNLSEILAN